MSSNPEMTEKTKLFDYDPAPPNDWRVAPLSEISIIRFSNVDKKSKRGESSIKLCNYMDVYANEYITSKLNFMEATATSDEIAKYLVEEGDVIVTKDSETSDDIGVPAAVAEKISNLVCGYHLAQIKPNAALVNSIFLAKQIGHDRIARHFSRLANGSTRYGLSTASFEDVEIWLPPFPEQRKIAKILTTVDNLIEKTEALIAKYEAIKQGMMHDLFTRGVDEKGRLRPSYQEAPELYKETKLGWIPEKWEVKELDATIRIIDCKHFTPSFRTEGFPFIRPRNIKLKGLDFTDLDFVSEKDYKILTDKHEPRKGDIVFSRNASFGIPCLVEKNIRFAIGQDVVIMTEIYSSSQYIYYALLSQFIVDQIRRASTGSTFGRINLEFIRKLLIPVPSITEQELIAKAIRSVTAKISTENVQIEKLGALKTALMQDLLTGKVRVDSKEGAIR